MNRPNYTTHKSFHKMVTPEKNPSLFRVEEFGGAKYHVPIFCSMWLDTAIKSSAYRYWRDKYKELHADELTDGKIDNDKYEEWSKGEEGNSYEITDGERRVVAKLLFTPIGSAPAIDTEDGWSMLPLDVYLQVRSFTKPTSPDKSNGQATSATITVNSPDSVTA